MPRKLVHPGTSGTDKRRQRMQSNLRREQLLDCAVRVIARNGLGSSPHAATAEEAGVSVPTVFAYFPTRLDLLRAVLGEVDRFYKDLSKTAVYRNLNAVESIMAFLEACAKAVSTHPDHTRIWLDWTSSIGQEDLWSMYLDFHEKSVDRVAAVIRKGQREGSIPRSVIPQEAALLICSGGHTVLLMMLTHTPMRIIKHFHHELVRGALHLVTEGGAEPKRGSRPRQQGQRRAETATGQLQRG